LASWYIYDGPTGKQGDKSEKEKLKLTIGYGLRSEDPPAVNLPAPELVPTSLKFLTDEYRSPGQHEGEEGIPQGDTNMLLYLQMTNNDPFPGNEILPYTGNFVSKGMPATMCIRRDIFWDQYLLREHSPLLQMFNETTYLFIGHHRMPDLYHPEYEIKVGNSSHATERSFFKWVPQENEPLPWKFSPVAKYEQIIRDR
jgi:hypothetical protein